MERRRFFLVVEHVCVFNFKMSSMKCSYNVTPYADFIIIEHWKKKVIFLFEIVNSASIGEMNHLLQ